LLSIPFILEETHLTNDTINSVSAFIFCEAYEYSNLK